LRFILFIVYKQKELRITGASQLKAACVNDPIVSIVFLNYNRLDETKITVEKLLGCASNKSIEIIAVDNGSSDGTAEFLGGLKDRLHVILLEDNQGIEGYNRGFEAASGEILIVLDDDSHIEPDTIDKALDLFAGDPKLGIVAFKIIDSQGHRFNTWHIPASDCSQESFAFVGCGFAIRREVFRRIGFYPGHFFIYHNEIFVAIRTKLLGYKVLFDPSCQAVHRSAGQQRDPSRRIYYTLRNTLYLIWTYYPLPIAIYLMVSRLFISFCLALFYHKGGVAFKALRDFAAHRPERIFLRREERRAILTPFFRQNSILHRIRYLVLQRVSKTITNPGSP
jgi:GT2 family glycosyltransferase